jgi:hypothetical protein
MDSNHRCLGVGQESSPLDHGTERRVEVVEESKGSKRRMPARGFRPFQSLRLFDPFDTSTLFEWTHRESHPPCLNWKGPVCRSGVFLLDHEPISAEAVGLEPTIPMSSGPPVFKTGSSSGRMTSVKLRELESNQRPPGSEPGVAYQQQPPRSVVVKQRFAIVERFGEEDSNLRRLVQRQAAYR